MTTMLPKITPSSIHAYPEQAKRDKRKVECFDIVGIAEGWMHKTGSNATGEKEIFTALTGVFEARLLQPDDDGVLAIYQSSVLYLPSGIHEMVQGPLIAAARDAATAAGVKADKLEKEAINYAPRLKFGFRISAVPNSNPRGYSWEAERILDVASSDPLLELRDALPALAAPKPVAQIETTLTAPKPAQAEGAAAKA